MYLLEKNRVKIWNLIIKTFEINQSTDDLRDKVRLF